jgi:LPS-assembly protein
MQIKNKIFITIILFFFSFTFCLKANEFDISAKEIIIDKDNKVIIGKGSVSAKDKEGKIIYGDKITYKKNLEFILAEGNVEILDLDGNIIKTDLASYNKLNGEIITKENTTIFIKKGYEIIGKNIFYQTTKKLLSSNFESIFTDIDGNIIETSMFQYDIKDKLFSSVGKIKVTDIKKNKYFFKEIYIDTKKREMIGSDVSVVLDQESFGVSENNDPRFVANDIFATKNKSILSKGVFTVCKIEEDDKCPPWSLKAKKITYDKVKKNIYYEHATLKIYDVPVFYFPKFFHPDPTVKRQSGFLFPFFTNSNNMGSGFSLPYYWAIDDDKDLTFSPKLYAKENTLILNEYRQAFNNGFLTLDTGFSEGYRKTSATKLKGSQNHIFANLSLDLGLDQSYDSNFTVNLERVSNLNYLKKHSINTELVDSEKTNLTNEIQYNYSENDTYLNITANVYENLNDSTNSKYEYVLPNITLGKNFFTEKYGSIGLKSNLFYNNYSTNKHETFLTNDLIWTPGSVVSQNGLINTLEGMLRNTNYEARGATKYKNTGQVNEIHGVIGYKSSLPLKKDGINYANLFSPNFMLRYAPSHTRNQHSEDIMLNISNLYSLNKTSQIENGLSAILGFDFKVQDKSENNNEKFSLSIGQVFSSDENKDLPSKSSLDQKMSDLVGNIDYNFSNIGNIAYKFTLDHNYSDLNYQEISTGLTFGLVDFNLDYLEETNHVGTEHYASSGITLNFNESSKLTLGTKKNFKTDSTELYNINYQYGIDCLKAGLVYRREFYQDSSLDRNDTLMFTITFVPFGKVNSPTKTSD